MEEPTIKFDFIDSDENATYYADEYSDILVVTLKEIYPLFNIHSLCVSGIIYSYGVGCYINGEYAIINIYGIWKLIDIQKVFIIGNDIPEMNFRVDNDVINIARDYSKEILMILKSL